MIVGSVTAQREAVVSVELDGRTLGLFKFEAVLDTGFDGHLSLPSETIQQYALRNLGTALAELADGSEIMLGVYEGDIIWGGETKCVEILESEGGPLVGMAMMDGFRLTMDVVVNGTVQISRISPT